MSIYRPPPRWIKGPRSSVWRTWETRAPIGSSSTTFASTPWTPRKLSECTGSARYVNQSPSRTTQSPNYHQIPITNPKHPRLAPQVPVLCAYTRVDKPPPDPLPPSPITAGMYRRLTMDPNLPPYGPRCPFRPFTFESPGETPGAGTVLGAFILIYPRTGNWTDVVCFV